jgi:hypothetical protein
MPENLAHCRACRARLAEDGICPRCGCDFSLARRAMEQAGQRLAHALRALAAGEADVARSAVDASLAMHRQPLAQAIKDFLESPACRMEDRRRSPGPLPPAALPADSGRDCARSECSSEG